MTSISRAAVALAAMALTAAGCQTAPKPPPGPVVAMVNPCADLTVSIYFERDSVKLTREARAVLRGAAARTGAAVPCWTMRVSLVLKRSASCFVTPAWPASGATASAPMSTNAAERVRMI